MRKFSQIELISKLNANITHEIYFNHDLLNLYSSKQESLKDGRVFTFSKFSNQYRENLPFINYPQIYPSSGYIENSRNINKIGILSSRVMERKNQKEIISKKTAENSINFLIKECSDLEMRACETNKF